MEGLHRLLHTAMDDALLNVDCTGAAGRPISGRPSKCWRRPESLLMEYVFEWNPLLAEAEAMEACEWLREAGFPQYAQMYKDDRFPIDLKAAKRDHDFLDDDALQAFFRRLDILNKCSSSKWKRSNVIKTIYESDDEEECALSNKWTFQRNSRLWSRTEAGLLPHLIDQPDVLFNSTLHSASSRDNVVGDTVQRLPTSQPPSMMPLVESESSFMISRCSESPGNQCSINPELSLVDTNEVPKAAKTKPPSLLLSPFPCDSEKQAEEALSRGQPPDLLNNNKDGVFLSDSRLPSSIKIHGFPVLSRHLSDSEATAISPSALSPSLRRAASVKFRGAFGLLRRMEGLRKSLRKHNNKTDNKSELTKLDIGSPVLIESPEILSKMDALHCCDINPVTENSEDSEKPVIGLLNCNNFVKEKSPVVLSLQSSYSSLDSFNIPQVSKNNLTGSVKPLNKQVDGGIGEGICVTVDKSDLLSDDPKACPTAEIYRRSHSLDAETKNLEEAAEIISELLKSISLEMPVNNKTRISIYDNVSSDVSSGLENELDVLLNELYKNIDSLDNSMSKVESVRRGQSPASSVSTLDEDDPAKVLALGPCKKNLVTVDLSGGCESTDGNTSTTTSEGSYILDCSAKPDPAMCLFINETNLAECIEDPFPVAEDADSPQVALEIPSDAESAESAEQREDDWSYPTERGGRERRDSGVGSSLTRTASSKRQKRPRLRWHSFAKSHQMSVKGYDQPISNLSAGQLAVLRKLSLLKVTATLEKYSPANKANWSWFVPRLRRHAKIPNYSERNVFGIPIAITYQRHGQPLPQCILYAMRYLRRSASDSVGIFRKPGVRARVQNLRIALESDSDAIDFGGLSAYDVADLLKLYFRELPECLLTNKLSHVFISTFLYVPVDMREELIQLTLLLLPDEHRLTLQSLLLFLSDMAQHSESNQMNASNLAVCFAPSLFHLCCAKFSWASSAKQIQKRAAMPSEKDLMEQKVAHECLTYMIANATKIFAVSKEMLSTCQLSYLEQGNPVPLEELCRKYGKCESGDYSSYVDSCIQGVLKESRDKFKGWVSCPVPGGDVDLAYKKVGDGHPLRLWKFCVEVEAPPEEVLNRALRERHLWDDDIMKWRIVEKLDKHTEVFQYVLNSMVPHPTRDFSELRSWRTDLPRGVCILISTSVEHAHAPLMGDIRGIVLASRYLIEPCGSGKSRLTHIIRIDLRGHSLDWYNNVYGHICVNYARRIRDSFKASIAFTCGPETKV